MILKSVFVFIFFFVACFSRVGLVYAKNLEDVNLENDGLQMEIEAVRRNISALENNPSDDPKCSSFRTQLSAVQNSKQSIVTRTAEGKADVATIEAELKQLRAENDELDKKLKSQKDYQIGMGVTAGVTALAAGGAAIWAHTEKNKISATCLQKVFSSFTYDYSGMDCVELNKKLTDLRAKNRDCKSCCLGKESECSAKNDEIKGKIEAERKIKSCSSGSGTTGSDNQNIFKGCEGALAKDTLFDAMKEAIKIDDDNDDGNDNGLCYNSVKENYGKTAVKESMRLFPGKSGKIKEKCYKMCGSDDFGANCIESCDAAKLQIGAQSSGPAVSVMQSSSVKYNCRLGFLKSNNKFKLNAYADKEADDYKKDGNKDYKYRSIGQMSVEECVKVYCHSMKKTDGYATICETKGLSNGGSNPKEFDSVEEGMEFLKLPQS